MSAQTNVRIGDEFLGYRIDEAIGQGGMGVVYRAYDLRLKRAVALKFVAPKLALDERFRNRFLRESELAASLEHPNAVPIHDAGEIDGRLYLAMRYVEGTDLRALLRTEGRLAPARTMAICAQVAGALDAAHEKGLVHRDVKPSNVLLDQNEHVYLADFGLTRRSSEQGVQALDRHSVGTPAYLAPEQVEGGAVDGRTDVYSLGCLLFECLTGEPPFPRRSLLAVAWAHLEDEPPSARGRNRELPERIDAVIRKAMAKEPEDRYATCGALTAAAEQALGLRPTPLYRRRAVLLAAPVAVAAVLAAALVIRGARTGPESAPVVRANTVVRIDPRTNTIAAVVDVGARPSAIAVGGRRVWVYNSTESTISEIDARTSEVEHTTAVPPASDPGGTGPVLAADARGAWFAGGYSTPSLTRIRAGGGKHEYSLDTDPTPKAVAVGEGAVWVLGPGIGDNHVLRVDPATGRAIGRARLPRSSTIDGLAVGLGAVWVLDSARAVLYRVDPRSVAVTGRLDLGKTATRPVIAFGSVWVHVSDDGGTEKLVDPRTLRIRQAFPSFPPKRGHYAAGFGSIWWYDVPTGTVVRFDHVTKQIADTIRVTEAPLWQGLCMTSIATGAGAVWVTMGELPTALTCP